MRTVLVLPVLLLALAIDTAAQEAPTQPAAPAPTPAAQSAQSTAPSARITLDDALRLARQHNHALLALRSTILQNQAMETTANLRPNPNLNWDAQFLPLFQPGQFSEDYFDNNAQFDIGVSYLFERGKKRQR